MSLGRGTLIAYALPAMPLALLGLPLVIYLPKVYAAQPGLSLAAVGGALLLARLWDLVSDPLAGMLTDRLRPLAWRRRLTLLAGVPLLLVGTLQLFDPDVDAGLGYLLAWSLVLYTGWSLVVMPYFAWGAELVGRYHERSRVTAYREGAVILGTLAAVLLPAVATDDVQALRWLGWAVVLTLPLAVILLLWRVREPVGQTDHDGASQQLARDPLLRRLLLAFLLNGTANAVPASLFLLYVSHVLAAPQHAWWLLAVYFTAGLVGFGLWLPVSQRFGKHRAWALSMLAACGAFAWVPWFASGDLGLFVVVCLLTGLSLGVDMALPASIQADVADRHRQGAGRTGVLFGLWGMSTKLALALGVGLALPLVQWLGFDPETASGGDGLWALSLVYGLLPIPFKLAAAWLMWRFPSTKDVPQEVEDELEAMGSRAAVRAAERL
jgi:Na+/melibiose symporter-like transporter